MDYGAPFTLNQTINLYLTQALANGNLGNLAGGPTQFGTQVKQALTNSPFSAVMPKGNVLETLLVRNPSASNILGAIGIYNITGSGVATANFYYATTNPVTDYLPANVVGVYNNGASGVGATLTTVIATMNDASGNALVNGGYYLIMNQTTRFQNGIYAVSGVGAAIVFTRDTNFDSLGTAALGAYVVFSAYGGLGAYCFRLNGSFGTGDILFSLMAGPGSVITPPIAPEFTACYAGGLVFTDSAANLSTNGLYDGSNPITLAVLPVPASLGAGGGANFFPGELEAVFTFIPIGTLA